MSRLIDASNLKKTIHEKSFNSGMMNPIFTYAEIMNMVDVSPTVKAILLDKLKQAMEQIVDEKDFAYADFDEYKREILGVEDADDLPDDDFRYGMERCLQILNMLIAESEV